MTLFLRINFVSQQRCEYIRSVYAKQNFDFWLCYVRNVYLIDHANTNK